MDLKNLLSEHMYRALEEFKAGKALIVIDDYDRENEGDIVVAAEHATPEMINFMAKHGKGLICLAIDRSYAERFELKPMVENNKDPKGTAFTVTIDAHPKHGITTGISAYERAKTVEVLLDPSSTAEDMVAPGHMFPLIAKPDGVLERRGHTEASTDLCKMLGMKPAAVIVEVMRNDGHMARLADLRRFAKRFNCLLISVEEIVQARLAIQAVQEQVVSTL